MRVAPLACLGFSAVLQAQSPLDPELLRAAQAVKETQTQVQDPTPKSGVTLPGQDRMETTDALRLREEERLDREIRALRAKEKGPRRFASDLFEMRQRGSGVSEGGVADDYVLGVGDRLQINVFGSATFEIPAQVDGRGELVIPKIGSVRVGGKTLAYAKQAVQGAVAKNFSRSTVDLQVVKLREIRVFVMGEVYKPGSYLVSSLSSLVNVLSLAGGPSSLGSYREIRVMRGGKAVHRLDLYPLRAEGEGNPNVALQSGDVIFVPLAQMQVTLEGAFPRVALTEVAQETNGPKAPDSRQLAKERMEREIKALEAEAPRSSAPPEAVSAAEDANTKSLPRPLSQEEIKLREDRLILLKTKLAELQKSDPLDTRLPRESEIARGPVKEPKDDRLEWRRRWEDEGEVPRMRFELRTGETVADALRFAGGLLPEAGEGTLVRRFLATDGVLNAQSLTVAQAAGTPMQPGDVLSALPHRERTGRVVTLAGHIRVPGPFARLDGMKVADLLKRDQQVLPDTYAARGEILRTRADQTTQLLPFDVTRAMAGDPEHNLPLEDRDQLTFFSVEQQRLKRRVEVTGPVQRPGEYLWHDGMRVSDLLFRAGLLLKQGNGLVAELARTREGQPSDVRPLDLARLLSTDSTSPVSLKDDAVNPVLRPDDRVSLYEKPDYRPHRVVSFAGYVSKPGEYALDRDRMTLSQMLQRAGGFTPDASPRSGVFLRRVQGQATVAQAAEGSGISAEDPTAKGINEVLERLNETKRQPVSGTLLRNPLLHGLAAGKLNRLVVDFEAAIKGDPKADVELQDGDQILIPRRTDSAYVVGETASPFATYKVADGMKVSRLLELAGGTTRNADRSNIRLLKADGRILDTWVMSRQVEPGDTVLVPQKIRRDTTWQENLQALTPLAIMLNVLK